VAKTVHRGGGRESKAHQPKIEKAPKRKITNGTAPQTGETKGRESSVENQGGPAKPKRRNRRPLTQQRQKKHNKQAEMEGGGGGWVGVWKRKHGYCRGGTKRGGGREKKGQGNHTPKNGRTIKTGSKGDRGRVKKKASPSTTKKREGGKETYVGKTGR